MLDWVQELPAEVMLCDPDGLILAMNAAAQVLFAKDGGRDLLGRNVLACHPHPARGKLERMLKQQTANAYFNTEHGEKRFFFQSPWYRDGHYAGFVEISFVVPEGIPHFIPDKTME
jgi:PAS domain-containing protein